MFKRLVILAALLVAAPASAQELFRSGFEGSGLAGFDYLSDSGQIVSTGCRAGTRCAQFRVAGGRDQQNVFVSKNISHAGEIITISGWWKFEEGFSFDPGGEPWGYEHKLVIMNVGNDIGRLLINLRGGGLTPNLQVHFERLESLGSGISKHSTVRLKPDGKWHKLEAEIRRVSGTGGRLRLWLDNELALDESGRVCGNPCSPVREVWFGAYSNQGAPKNQNFWVDDVLVSGSPRGATTTPPVTPPPANTDRAEALEAIAKAAAKLEQLKAEVDAALNDAVRALDQR